MKKIILLATLALPALAFAVCPAGSDPNTGKCCNPATCCNPGQFCPIQLRPSLIQHPELF